MKCRELTSCARWPRRENSVVRVGIVLVTAILVAVGSVLEIRADPSDWPERTVTVVVPFGAGGNTDGMARLASNWLAARLKHPFVIDNKPGAAGSIGTTQAARAAADGHTLLFAAAPQIAIVPFIQKVSYDPRADFTPVSIFGTSPFLLAVNNSVPAHTVRELVALARANPGKLNYASGGVGSLGHLAGALFAARAGIEVVHVPFRAAGPVLTALIGGQVQLYLGPASELIPYAESGQIRLIGAAAAKRLAQYPNLSLISDDYPDLTLASWNGFLVPSKTRKSIVERLAALTAEAARDPAIVEGLLKLGIEPSGTTPDEFAQTIRREQPLFDAAIKAAAIKPD